jgi:hypothetical protein
MRNHFREGKQMRVPFLIAAVALCVFGGSVSILAQSGPKAGLKGDKAALKGGAAKAPWMQLPGAQTPPFPWIDVHIHLTGPNASSLSRLAGTAVAEMKRYGVVRSLVMPTPLAPYENRDFVAAARRLPAGLQFLGGSSILNPVIHDTPAAKVTDAVRKRFVALAEQVLKDGARGFGEMATLHFSLADGHKYMRAEPDHPLFLALAEVAGRHGSVIDLHHDPIVGTMPLAEGFKSPPNPKTERDNMAAFERLLEHDRNAKIFWAHGGMDPFGEMTPQLVGKLMDAHPNLYMSLRVAPPPLEVAPFGLRIKNKLMGPKGLDPAWLEVLQRHADRFVLGTDTFHLVEGSKSPQAAFVAGNEPKYMATNLFLSLLPPELGQKIASENAILHYRLDEPKR